MSEPLWQPRTDAAARLLGAAFVLGGAGLIGMQVRGIVASVAHGETVTYFAAAFGLGEMGVILGLYWCVRGLAGYHAVRRLQQDRAALRWVALATLVVVGGTLVALEAWLRHAGYES